MDKISPQHLNQILGIYPPFQITNISLSTDDNAIKITLSNSDDKKGFFSRNKENSPTLHWQHVRIGRFDTEIEIKASSSTKAKISSTIPPSFLGPIDKKYTNQLQQMILFGLKKGFESTSLSTLVGIDISTIKDIEKELTNSSNKASSLPPSTAKIWQDIVNGDFQLKTNVTGLNMLIATVTLLSSNSEDNTAEQQESCEKLYSYFAKHKSQLKSEYNQLGISDSEEKEIGENTEETKKKLVLTKDHSIWNQLLTGKMMVASNHTGFNLNMAKMRQDYMTAHPMKRIEVVKSLMAFIKKNMASLKDELKIIRDFAEEIGESSTNKSPIPPANDMVWDDILDGSLFIKSSFIPFNLIISKLKNYRTMSASNEAREFIIQNSSVLVNEIQQINEYIQNKSIGAVEHA